MADRNRIQLSTYQRAQRRISALDQERSSYITHWQDISKVLSPRNSRFLETDTNNGTKKHNMVWDSTAILAHRTLVAGLMAGATSPARPWFRVTTPDPDMADFRGVKEWLHKLTRLFRLIYERSNTYRALPRIYKQLSGYGTAASVMEPHFDTVIHHHTQAIGEYMLGTDGDGNINAFAREFLLTVDQVVRKFGYENCSQTTRNAWDNAEYDGDVYIQHLIEPRDIAERQAGKRDARNMPFLSVYLETTEGDRSDNKLLRESGYREFPVLAPRWETLGYDAYGSDCPGMTLLGDVKNLQHDKKMRSKAIDYQADPPVQAPTAMKNQEMDLLPGGVSYYDGTSPNSGIKTSFDVNLNLQHLREDMAELRSQIHSGFFADLFLMLANDTRSNITAREIAERHEEKLLMLGPVLESVHNELLGPMIDNTFTRVIEAGIMPPPPLELEGQDLKIEFVSMLAQAQKAVGLQSVDRLLGTVGAIAVGQVNAGRSPDVWDKVNTDEIVDGYADMLGIDPSLIVANDDVLVVRKQRAQVQAAAAAQATRAAQAETAKTMGDTDPRNLQAVVNQFSGYAGA